MQHTIHIPRFLVALAFGGLLAACSNPAKDQQAHPDDKAGETSRYPEGAIFPAAQLPKALGDWLSYYQAIDSSVRLERFPGSGVALHFGPLEPAAAGDLGLKKAFYPLMAFSPDSSRALDWMSYGHQWTTDEKGVVHLTGGDTDQEVDLLEPARGRAHQLLFNGPESLVESAGWLGNQAFMLGTIQADPERQSFIPEILLFNLKDSTFTNFRLNHSLPDSLLVKAGNSYTRHWLKQKNIPQ